MEAPSVTQPAAKATTAPAVKPTISPVCPKCAKNKKTGNPSCCTRGGAWFKKCGNDGGKFDHTWTEGIEACKNFKPTTSSVCSKCAKIKKNGILSCCARGGAWFKECGSNTDGGKFDHTWTEGIEACKNPEVAASTAKPIIGSGCPKCGKLKQGNQLSCCARGGTWFKKCGADKQKSEHTWFEGIQACMVVKESQEQQFGYSDNSQGNAITRDSDLDDVVTADCQGYCKLTHIGVIAVGILFVGNQMQM